jgi:hypothetical protein
MLMAYYGWVPTIVGRLSFTLIASAVSARSRSRKVLRSSARERWFVGDDGERKVVLVANQLRWTSDELFPSPWDGKSHKNWIILVGLRRAATGEILADVDGRFVGNIFSLTPANFKHVSGALHARLMGDEFDQSDYDAINVLLLAKANVCALFSLERNGVVAIDVSRLSGAGYDNPDKFDHARMQMYIMLKDLVHIHQHHDLDEDQIISLQPGGEKPDQMDWAHRVLFDLYRYVVGLKRGKRRKWWRTDRREDYAHALGVLAYAQSLKKVIGERRQALGCNTRIPGYDNDAEIRLSIEAARDAAQLDHEGKYLDRIQVVALVAGLIAVYMTMLQTVGQYKLTGHDVTDLGAWFTGFVAKNFEFCFALPFVLVLPWWCFVYFKSGRLGRVGSALYDLVRLWLPLPGWVVVVGVYAFGLSVMTASVFLAGWILGFPS